MIRTAFLFIIFSISCGVSQNKKDTLTLNFDFKFNNEKLNLNKKYISKSKDTIELLSLKFYISKVRLDFDDNSSLINDGIYLIDIEKKSNAVGITINNNISQKKINKLTFYVGVDSLTNVSGALSGDLDPTKGMYWAWQSGYINFKLEGKSTMCSTPKNKFQFHIGGYLPPFQSIREVSVYPKENDLMVNLDISRFFSEINLAEINSIMIPGKKAIEMSKLITPIFYSN